MADLRPEVVVCAYWCGFKFRRVPAGPVALWLAAAPSEDEFEHHLYLPRWPGVQEFAGGSRIDRG